MKDSLVADLHIHSRYSRACSKSLNIENLEKYARIKGLDILGTGDFTHPLWLKELKEKLTDSGSGILKTNTGFLFVLSTEVANVFTQDGKGRRIHNILLAPSFEVVDQINETLSKQGRLDYDGRPIFGFNCIELVEMLKEISSDIEIIPAHCLLPNTFIHTSPMKMIKEVKEGDYVLTHTGKFRKITRVFKRDYSGNVWKIIPWYFRIGLTTTPEHPFFAIKGKKNCSWIKEPLYSERKRYKRKGNLQYMPMWIMAKNIEKGDFLVFPRPRIVRDKKDIKISDFVTSKKLGNGWITPPNSKNWRNAIRNEIKVDKDFCLLVGYYLSKGYSIRDEAIAFSFNVKERDYITQLISLMRNVFGAVNFKIDHRRKSQSDIIFYSHILNQFFKALFYYNGFRACNKTIPDWMIYLPKKKVAEILKGWWRGDAGHTVSKYLANQMKLICLKLGIIPSISVTPAEEFNVSGKHLFVFSNLSFFEEDYGMLNERCFKKFINKRKMKHGWVDKKYIYLPVRKVEKIDFKGSVYNLEVEIDNSYTSEFACVHNCWTPWFGIFGSASGFDSLKECFKEKVKEIKAIETGMSSDPEMNWHISELNNRSIVSFSDSHSFWPWRLGREATLFSKINSYNDLIKQIRENKFLGTIETDPAYGKYHWDGHRTCNFSCSPEETKRLRGLCPVCGRPLTIGVEYRVKQLTDQTIERNPNRKPFYKLLPLHEIISTISGSDMMSKKTWQVFNSLVGKFGSELNVLLEAPLEELKKAADEKIASAIVALREGRIKIQPGYDGVYGFPIFGKNVPRKPLEKFRNRQRSLADF